MKTTIKAHYAKVEGDYVIVRQIPYRTTRIILVCVLLVNVALGFVPEVNLFTILLISFVILVLDAILANDEKIYTVPKRDLIAIKHYPRRHLVTVVFDDEKNKLEILRK